MVGQRAGWACLLLAIACDPRAGGRGGTADGGGNGGKADEATGFDPTLSVHQNAVRACLVEAANARSDDLMEAETDLLRCVTEANDAVWPKVQAVLPDLIPDDFTDDMIEPQGDEAERYAERLRASQALVCEVFGALLGGDDDEDYALMEMRCRAEAEVHTANLIDAHFDLDGRRLELVSTSERFERCDDRFEHDLDAGFSAAAAAFEPDAPKTKKEWLLDLHYHRRDCMKTEDSELRIGWASQLGTSDRHAEEDFGERLRIITRNFERESRAGRLLCRLFSYQSDEEEFAAARCMADSTMQAGRLYDTLLTLVDEEDDDEEPTPDPDPDPGPGPDPDPAPKPEKGEACYPGPDGKWDVCLPLVYPSSSPEGYDYAAPLNGNPNYRAPIGYLDLEALDASTRISADFTLGEVAHLYKGRYAVVQPHAIASLQQLRDDVGSITVNSGFRPPPYNESVGGATYSRHMYGDGFDMDPNAVSLSTLEDACQSNGGFLVEYTTHVHCDFRFDDADESFFGEP